MKTKKVEYTHSNKHIYPQNIFQKPVLGFCYFFNAYNDLVKDAVRSAGYKWARGNRHREYVFPPVDPLVFKPCCHFLDQDFWGKYEQQKERDSVFFFWGHGYELIDEAMQETIERKIDRISSEPEVEWSFVADLFGYDGLQKQ